MSEPDPTGRGLEPPVEAQLGDTRHPLFPWVALCVPFTVLAIFVGIVITQTDLGGRLNELSAARVEERQRYAIDHTPPSSVELVRSAFEKPDPVDWTPGEAWAVDDLLVRSEGKAGTREGPTFELLRQRFHSAFPSEDPVQR